LLVNLLNPHPRTPACPSAPEVLQTRECAPTPFPSVVFTFGFTIESIKELGGVSLHVLKLKGVQRFLTPKSFKEDIIEI
jgi:hypothetical protein